LSIKNAALYNNKSFIINRPNDLRLVSFYMVNGKSHNLIKVEEL